MQSLVYFYLHKTHGHEVCSYCLCRFALFSLKFVACWLIGVCSCAVQSIPTFVKLLISNPDKENWSKPVNMNLWKTKSLQNNYKTPIKFSSVRETKTVLPRTHQTGGLLQVAEVCLDVLTVHYVCKCAVIWFGA